MAISETSSVQYCVQQLCTVQCTHIWTDLIVLWIGFCLTEPISLCLNSFLYMYYVYHCILHACVGLWHGEVDLVGLKPILRTTTSFSALTLLVGSFDPKNPVPIMTYIVFSGTLNPTQSITHAVTVDVFMVLLSCGLDLHTKFHGVWSCSTRSY